MAPEVMFYKNYGLKVFLILFRLTSGLSALFFMKLYMESLPMIQAMPKHFTNTSKKGLMRKYLVHLKAQNYHKMLMIFLKKF
jgi:hypothetical protein